MSSPFGSRDLIRLLYDYLCWKSKSLEDTGEREREREKIYCKYAEGERDYHHGDEAEEKAGEHFRQIQD